MGDEVAQRGGDSLESGAGIAGRAGAVWKQPMQFRPGTTPAPPTSFESSATEAGTSKSISQTLSSGNLRMSVGPPS